MMLLQRLGALDEWLASGALLLMLAVPLLEIVLRPLLGQGVENAPVLVQHFGLVLAMFGALLADRSGHLTSLGGGLAAAENPRLRGLAQHFARASSAVLCGMLAQASWNFVATEMEAPRNLAYGLPGWAIQAAMPLGFLLLGMRIAARMAEPRAGRFMLAIVLPAAGFFFARHFDGSTLPIWPFALWLAAVLACGAPVFAVLGGLALALFWQDGQPLASVPLSHYQITVNPSLPALPLFTLAGLFFARTGAAARLGKLFTALFGTGVTGTAIAAAVLCSFFTALTGGSGDLFRRQRPSHQRHPGDHADRGDGQSLRLLLRRPEPVHRRHGYPVRSGRCRRNQEVQLQRQHLVPDEHHRRIVDPWPDRRCQRFERATLCHQRHQAVFAAR